MSTCQETLYRDTRISRLWAGTCQSGLSVAVFRQKVRENVTIEEVMTYQNPDILAKIRHELDLSERQAIELFDDLKRFLWLAAVSNRSVVPSPLIDEAWHRFILYTSDYAEFCERYLGGFLDHAPQRMGETRLTHEDLLPTIDAMHAEFGGKPSVNWDGVCSSGVTFSLP